VQAGCIGLALGCAWLSEPLAPALPEPPSFSGELAFAHLEKLVALGPRVAGTPGAERARGYIRGELEGLGLTVQEDAFVWSRTPESPSLPLANLWTEIPGPEAGLFVVATPLDSAPGQGAAIPGANEGGSGAALLLELARLLHERPLPYTVRLLFLDAELLDEAGAFLGSEQAHHRMSEAGELETLRLLLYVHQVGDRDLEIRRDLHSDRSLRDFFFAAAARTGHSASFSSTAPFDDLRLGHLVFIDHRFPRVVALADVRYGGSEIPGEHWRTASDDLANCSAQSLATVGTVVLAGLEAAAERQLVVDRATGAAHPHEGGHP